MRYLLLTMILFSRLSFAADFETYTYSAYFEVEVCNDSPTCSNQSFLFSPNSEDGWISLILDPPTTPSGNLLLAGVWQDKLKSYSATLQVEKTLTSPSTPNYQFTAKLWKEGDEANAKQTTWSSADPWCFDSTEIEIVSSVEAARFVFLYSDYCDHARSAKVPGGPLPW